MLTLLFYEREDGQPADRTALEDALSAIPGIAWEAPADAAYRPGRWRDPATGAVALWDLGEPPLHGEPGEQDQPGRTYSGWRQVPLTLSIPLAGPHWQAVTALAQVDRLLAAAPWLTPLATEDTQQEPDSEAGPFPFDRPRVIADWERQRAAQSEGLALPRLARATSVALWRYRVERAAGKAAHPDYHWPEAIALHDQATGEICTACLWAEPTEPFALPPVDVLVVRGGAVSSEPLRQLGGALAAGGATLIDPSPAVEKLHRTAQPLPAERFRALGDEDWQD